jgi:tRNA nucleotidyltransferase (CCA-adding enzyme)
VLDAAFEAQLDGAFADEAGGLAWLRAHLNLPPPTAGNLSSIK